MKLKELIKKLKELTKDQLDMSFTVTKDHKNDDNVFGILHINDLNNDELFTFGEIKERYEDIVEWPEIKVSVSICKVYFCTKTCGLYFTVDNPINSWKELKSLHFTTTNGALDIGHPYFII